MIKSLGFRPYKLSSGPKSNLGNIRRLAKLHRYARSLYYSGLPCCVKEDGPEYKNSPNDYDSPWKEALTDFFRPAIQLFSPGIYELIDWSVKPVFLDKEFQALKAGSTKGRKYVDKLVQVKLLSGIKAILIIHIEVQHFLKSRQAQSAFAKRMFRYSTHIGDRYPDAEIFSLGVVLDGTGLEQQNLVDNKGGKGDRQGSAATTSINSKSVSDRSDITEFITLGADNKPKNGDNAQQQLMLRRTTNINGCEIRFTFPVINLSYWLDKQAEIEQIAAKNPFAVVIMSQLAAIKHKQPASRFNPRVDLYRKLIQYGYSERTTKSLLRLIEWIVKIPAELELELYDKLVAISKENKMAFVSSMGRIDLQRATEKGIGLGQSDILLRLLRHKFGDLSDDIVNKIKMATKNQLEDWAINVIDAKTLDDVFK